MENCIFCKIVRGEIPSYKVYEDNEVLAFLDITPANEGHTLIIPKEHRANIFEIKDEELTKIVLTAKKLAEKYKEVLNMEHCNLVQSNGKFANQDVMHFHMHLVPRRENDGLNLWKGKQVKKPDFEKLAEKLKL